jgi:hypothetical protein
MRIPGNHFTNRFTAVLVTRQISLRTVVVLRTIYSLSHPSQSYYAKLVVVNSMTPCHQPNLAKKKSRNRDNTYATGIYVHL